MKLTVLGSGSCMVSQTDRTPSAYLLQTREKTVMIDTGAGSSGNIPDTDTDVQEIDAIINTHRHPDHISDLIPLIQDKIVRSGSGEEPDIELYGPEGHRDYLDMRLSREVPVELEGFEERFGFDLKVHEVADTVETPAGVLKVQEANHGPENFRCLSLSLDIDGRKVVFTGDTDYHDGLVGFAEGADLLITDCSKPHRMKAEGHMTGRESGMLASKAGVNTLLLSHLYPEADEHGVREEAEEEFDGEVLVAEDLMELAL